MTLTPVKHHIVQVIMQYVPKDKENIIPLIDKTLAEIGILESRVFDLAQTLSERLEITLDREAVATWETVADVVRDVQNMLTPKVMTDDTVEAMKNMPAINQIERYDVFLAQEAAKHPQDNGLNLLDLYQQIATKSAIYPGKGTPFGLMYAALGLAEAGEVQNKVKKAFRDDGVISFGPLNDEGGGYYANQTVRYGQLTPERRAQIIKELGGAMWYISAVCDEIGATMSEVALTNLDELCSRGERGTLRGDGDNR